MVADQFDLIIHNQDLQEKMVVSEVEVVVVEDVASVIEVEAVEVVAVALVIEAEVVEVVVEDLVIEVDEEVEVAAQTEVALVISRAENKPLIKCSSHQVIDSLVNLVNNINICSTTDIFSISECLDMLREVHTGGKSGVCSESFLMFHTLSNKSNEIEVF